jgi:hypothetical protein
VAKQKNGMKTNLFGESMSSNGLIKIVRKKTKSQESTEDFTSSGDTEHTQKWAFGNLSNHSSSLGKMSSSVVGCI